MNRIDSIRRAESECFDLCIIGGGITGAGVLANAVSKGYKAVLIEKSDFASGTSSRSSKLIHGGLRYLQYLQFKLVYEALHERGHLLRQYPHLVKPVAFLLPSFNSRLDLFVKDIGLSLYDLLAGQSVIPHHVRLNAKQALAKMPGMKSANLKGGIYFWDACTNDARLTVEVMQECAASGGVAINYLEAGAFDMENDDVRSVRCTDQLTGNNVVIRAKTFVNATGVWTDEVLGKLQAEQRKRMKPTKGVHVVIPSAKLPAECVAVVTSQTGTKRYLYTLPWEHGLTVLGATDTDYNGEPDNLDVSANDVKYVLDAFNEGFPSANITVDDIVSVFVGLRPLLAAGNEKDTYSRSREYEIWWSKNNFINIAGGKLTSFFSMGERCLEVIEKKSGVVKAANPAAHEAAKYAGPWSKIYGDQGRLIEDIITDDPANNELISANFEYVKAEIIFFIRHQFAEQAEDILTRRTSVTYAMKELDNNLVDHVVRIMAEELGKDENWMEEQKLKYQRHWRQYHPLLPQTI